MGKLSEFNKNTQDAYNAKMAEQIANGGACFLRPIKGWELLNLSPYNYKSGKIYEGQNFVNLLNTAINYTNGAFLTFNQLKELGGKVNEGEHAQSVIFWSFSEAKDENGEKLLNKKGECYTYAFLKRFNVFNIAQTTLADLPTQSPKAQNVEQMRQAVLNFCANNKGLFENVANYNEFLAIFGEHKAQLKDDDMRTSWDVAKSCLIGELVNLFICAKIGADFNPIFANYQSTWAELISGGVFCFLKCAKIAKEIGEEILTWQTLDKVAQNKGELLSA